MEDVLRAINELLSNVELTERQIKVAKGVLEKAEEVIVYTDAMYRDEQINAPINAQLIARDLTLESAPLIFTGEVEEAVSKNDEFAYYAFLNPLYQISHNEDLYSIIPNGAGWGSTVLVTLNMNDVAGSIDDYAQAIQQARDNLDVGKGDAAKASTIWKNKIYLKRGGYSAYGLTISERLSSSPSPAPFWSLLNDGNKINMSSSYGGTPYPNRGGTHFVERAEEKIKKEFLFQMSNLKQQSQRILNNILSDKQEVLRAKTALEKKIENIGISAENLKKVANEIGVDIQILSATKLYRAIAQLKSGQLKSQYYIGAPGFSKRIRPGRLSSIVSRLGD